MNAERTPTSPSAGDRPREQQFLLAELTSAINAINTAIANAAARTSQTLSQASADISTSLSQTASSGEKTAVDTISEISETISCATSQTQQNFAAAASEVGATISSAASQTSQAFRETANNLNELAVQQTYQLFEQATQTAAGAIAFATDNWWLRQISRFLKLDWLFDAVMRIDSQKAAAAVQKLQQEHPNASSREIARQIMLDKARNAGGIGFISSLVPGSALALLAIDLAAIAALQAEMVYQIAAAYGLDLQDPARQGEVLAILGLAVGSAPAIRLSLSLLRNLPLAGPLIGASTNAILLYSLGYAACQFYEGRPRAASDSQSS